ncbi:putative uncharacterized protein DDB_G0274535 isoform X1 [Hydra vulgaris]|nr:putative uncharacterized protein DDB_G0274535 isoform X2 [Hydra vulgaris]XP_047137326.1 putative uncharacterized protein DDB_G0274535 isoform X2 [Hydra vulgaris]
MTSDSIDNSELMEHQSIKNLSYFIKLDKAHEKNFTSLYAPENALREKIIPVQPRHNQLHEKMHLEASLTEINQNENNNKNSINYLEDNPHNESIYEGNRPPNFRWSENFSITGRHRIDTLTEFVRCDQSETSTDLVIQNDASTEINDNILHLNAIEIINKVNISNSTDKLNIFEKKNSENFIKTKNIENQIGIKKCEEASKNNSSIKRRVLGRSWSTISDRNTCNTSTASTFTNAISLKETIAPKNETTKRRNLSRSLSTNSQNNNILSNVKLINSEEIVEGKERSWSTSTERNSICSTTPLMTSEEANKHQTPQKRKVLHRSLSSCLSRFKQISVFQMRSHQKLFSEDGLSDEDDSETDLIVHNLRKCVSVPDSLNEEDLDTSKLFLPRRMAICSEVRTPALKQLKAYLVLTRLKQYNFL